jgi:VanZ family protein
VPKQRRNTFLWLAWLLFVTYTSLASFPQPNGNFIHVPHLDKGVHFVFYGVMAYLGALALRDHLGKKGPMGRALFFSLCFAIIYGIFIEVLQYVFTENRQGDVLDALANSLGALAGICAVFIRYSGKWPLK